MAKALLAMLAIIFALKAEAQQKSFALVADPALVESGLLKYILPRFSLKTGVKVALTASDGDATLGVRPEHLTAAADGPVAMELTMLERLSAQTLAHGRLDGGGEIVATGTPEEVAQEPESYTGAYLLPHLRVARPKAKKRA